MNTSPSAKTLWVLFTFLGWQTLISQTAIPISVHDPSHPNRAEYLEDSLFIMSKDGLKWNYYWQAKWDSLVLMACENMNRAAKWMEQDTMTAIYYHSGEQLCGQAIAEQGDFKNGIPQVLGGMEALAKYYDHPDAAFFISTSAIALGRIYESTGHLKKALERYIEADRIQTELVKKGVLSPVWLMFKANYLADIYYKLGKFPESEKLFKKASKMDKAVYGFSDYTRYDFDLVALYLRTGAERKAQYLQDSIEQYLATHPFIEEYSLLQFLYWKTVADAYFDVSKLEKARDFYLNGLQVLKRDPKAASEQEANGGPASLAQLCRIHLAFGEPALARDFLERSKAYWTRSQGRSADFRMQLTLLEGEVNRVEKNWPLALKWFNLILKQQIPAWSKIQTPSTASILQWPVSPRAMDAMRGRLQVLDAQLTEKKAGVELSLVLQEAGIAQDYLESVLNTYSTDQAKGKIFFENRAVYEIPVRLLYEQYRKTGDSKWWDRLFYTFEKSKALQLLTTVKDKQLQSAYGIPEELLAQERDLRREIGFYKKELAAVYLEEGDDLDQKLRYQQYLHAHQVKFDALQLLLKENHPEYYQLKYDLSVARPVEVRDYLRSRQGVISYFWSTDRIYAIGLTKHKNLAWEIPVGEDLLDALECFQREILSPPGIKENSKKQEAWLARGNFLYQQLIEPALQRGIRSWIIIPDGNLAYLPWSTLLTKPVPPATSYRDLPYLIKQFTLQQEYSVTLLLDDIPRHGLEYPYVGVAPEYNDQQNAFAAALDTTQLVRAFGEGFREGYVPLQFNRPEVENAHRYYPTGIQLIGAEATESDFKNFSSHGKILHLAMHAFTNDLDPMLSHLAFSDGREKGEDGFLFAYELYNMHIPSDLAILSACNTGSGLLHDGQGVMSLARAFKYAGCRDVLMTLWPAHDRSTAKIMSTFFAHLQEPIAKAKVLQKASLDYLAQEPNEALTHPYYWAGFTLIGSGEPMHSSGKTWFWWVAVIGLAVCLFWFRKYT